MNLLEMFICFIRPIPAPFLLVLAIVFGSAAILAISYIPVLWFGVVASVIACAFIAMSSKLKG